MKKNILFLICCLPFIGYSQKPVNSFVPKPEAKEVSKADTILSKDPMNPNKSYCVIHNFKGILKAQGFLLNGKKEGAWREYNDVTGMITKITDFTGGIQNGASLTFSNNGTIVLEETYMNDKKNGQRCTYVNFGGRVKALETFKDDVLEGPKKTFYDDGKIQEEGAYKNGNRDGVVKWFLQNGYPTMEYTYSNGDLQGPAKVFDEKGRLKLEGDYKNNNEEGEWKEYQDSLLVKKIIYKQGQILKEVPVKK